MDFCGAILVAGLFAGHFAWLAPREEPSWGGSLSLRFFSFLSFKKKKENAVHDLNDAPGWIVEVKNV